MREGGLGLREQGGSTTGKDRGRKPKGGEKEER